MDPGEALILRKFRPNVRFITGGPWQRSDPTLRKLVHDPRQ
jgi:hypothetical protein